MSIRQPDVSAHMQLVTCAGIIHTIINIYVLGMKPMDENGMGEGYEATKPWHPLYNIISFSIFGFAYMNGLAEPTITEALITGAIWAGICIVFDVFGWVLIKPRGACLSRSSTWITNLGSRSYILRYSQAPRLDICLH